MIEGIRSALHLKVNSAFRQLCVLEECHKKLCDDLQDKDTVLGIDSTCLDLNNNQAEAISLQEDPTRIVKGYVSSEELGLGEADKT